VFERQQDNDEWCAPDAGMGDHVRAPSSLAKAYTMLYILFFLPFSPVAISTVTATRPVFSVTEFFLRQKRRQKEKKKRKREREEEEQEMVGKEGRHKGSETG